MVLLSQPAIVRVSRSWRWSPEKVCWLAEERKQTNKQRDGSVWPSRQFLTIAVNITWSIEMFVLLLIILLALSLYLCFSLREECPGREDEKIVRAKGHGGVLQNVMSLRYGRAVVSMNAWQLCLNRWEVTLSIFWWESKGEINEYWKFCLVLLGRFIVLFFHLTVYLK